MTNLEQIKHPYTMHTKKTNHKHNPQLLNSPAPKAKKKLWSGLARRISTTLCPMRLLRR